jgi:superfamily II DNA or RNA helicase
MACIERSSKKLQPHQRAFVRAFIRSKRRGAIAIHATGSGKSLLSVAASRCYLDMNPDGHVIVITLASLLLPFKEELLAYEKNIDLGRYRFFTYTSFANEAASKGVGLCEGALIIIDEVHSLRNYMGVIYEAVHRCTSVANKVLCMTATPEVNGDYDLFAIMAIATGTPIVDKYVASAIMDSDKLSRAYFGCVLSHYKPDPKRMSEYFPKVEERIVPIAMDAATLRAYHGLENDGCPREIKSMFHLSGAGDDTDLQSFFNGHRRVSSSSKQKMEWIMDFVEHVQAGRHNARLGLTPDVLRKHTKQIIIFTHFKEHGTQPIITGLTKLGVPFSFIDGSTPKSTRAKIVKDYVAGLIRVILISAAGGTGISLMKTGYIIFVEPSWNESEVTQVKARGVRFKGHMDLPKSMRNVLVIKLMLIKPTEARVFAKMIADELPYEQRDELPSIDIKMFIDSHRKQAQIDARLKMLEARVPTLEDCESSGHPRLPSLEIMRTFRRTSAKIASTPSGLRTYGHYTAPGRRWASISHQLVGRTDALDISLNDTFLREVIVGSGAMRLTVDTAVLFAGALELLMPTFVAHNKHVYPHVYDGVQPTRRYRIGVINWGINFATGARVHVTDQRIRSTVKHFDAVCDLVLIIAGDSKRAIIKDTMDTRATSEATYISEFDKIAMKDDPGLVVIAG